MEETKEKVEDQPKEITLKDLSTDELVDIIRQTRKEAKDHRLKARDLADKLEQTDSEKRKGLEDKMKADGEIQKLLEQRDKELESMKPKAEAFEHLRMAEIEDAKRILGDDWDEEYSNLSITALRRTIQLLEERRAVAGADNGKIPEPPKVQLTDAEKKEAKLMGLSDEAYSEIQKNRKGNKK